MFEFLFKTIIEPIVGAIIFIGTIIKDFFSGKRAKLIVNIISLIIILLILSVSYFLTIKKKEVKINWSLDDVVGYYTAVIKDNAGFKEFITLDIKKIADDYGDPNIECTLAGYYDIKPLPGTVNLKNLLIYIPGFGIGKVVRSQFGEVVLNFFINGRKIKFTRGYPGPG